MLGKGRVPGEQEGGRSGGWSLFGPAACAFAFSAAAAAAAAACTHSHPPGQLSRGLGARPMGWSRAPTLMTTFSRDASQRAGF